MKHNLRLLMLTLLCAVFGTVWSQEVTYDFTGSGWSVTNGTLTNGTVSMTGEGKTNFKMNDGYFFLGQKDAYLNLPIFDFVVTKIEVVGRTGASSSVKQNIFVGDTPVSDETTGATGTNTYGIDEDYQEVGTQYTLKVTSSHNTQITAIKIYKYSSSSGPDDPSVTLTTTDIKVGETTTISFPSNLPDVSFSSDDEDVATVDEEGVITGTGEGQATISMTWEGNAVYNEGMTEFTVNVSKHNANVTLAKTNLMVGRTTTISYPDDLFDILFQSDNEDVATVDEDGIITAVSVGEATISVVWGNEKYYDGEAEFSVTVTDPSSTHTYVKVTNLNQVVAGNKYILVSNNAIAMGAQNGNFRDEVDISLGVNNTAYVNDDVAVLTLGGKAGAWTFSPNDTEGELSFINDGNYLVTKTDATDAEKLWRISDDFQVWHRAYPGRTIQDNHSNNNNHFGCYMNTQKPSYLYVEEDSPIDENYKKDPVLSIANAFLEMGSGPKIPKVSTPSNGTITYSGFDSNIVTFTDGKMEAVAEGTTTVTATLEATAEYEGDVTTFTITVVPAHSNLASHLYKKVTSTNDITSGKYLIVYEERSVAFNGGLSTLDAADNVIEVVMNNNKIFCDKDAYFLIDKEAGTLRSASGFYIGVSSNSNGLKTSTDASTYTHEFSIGEDENAVIKANNFEESKMTLLFNTSGRFRYYSAINQTNKAIQLYKAVDPFIFSIKEEAYDGKDHYATISALGSEEYYQVSGGAEVFTLTVDNQKLVLSDPFTDGDLIPSNGAYLVRGVPGEYEFTAANSPDNSVQLGNNMLVSTGDNGVTAEEMAAAYPDPDYKFYKLSLNTKTKKVGFLWGKENGAPFTYYTGHQAYLPVLDSSTGSSVSAFYFDETSDATGISDVHTEEVTTNAVYSLSGVRMESTTLPKGIYIMNGKKVVIK